MLISSAPFELSAQREGLIARRWEFWKPWALRETARIVHDVDSQKRTLELHRQRHRDHVILCLRTGVSWKIMTRLGLDDPRMTDIRRDQLIAEAAAKHRTQVAAQAHRRNPIIQRERTQKCRPVVKS